MKPTTYIGELFTLGVLEAPKCSAQEEKDCTQICACLTHVYSTLKRLEESENQPEKIRTELASKKINIANDKIMIKTCGNGAIKCSLIRTDGLPMSEEDIITHKNDIIPLISKLFNDYDPYHIIKGDFIKNFTFNKEKKWYEITFHRGIPKRIATKNFPKIIDSYE